jgi:hypothetical protein
MTIKKLHSHDVGGTRADIAKDYVNLYFDDATNSILLPDPTGILETKVGATGVTQFPGYKGMCVDDGVAVQLDNIMVQMATSGARSLQFKVATGTLSVNITGQIYWANGSYGGNYGANYWNANALNTSWVQPFGWNFPWQGDKAEYNVQDLTNKRFYRITLSVGGGYKNNFIIMERLV